MRKAPILLLAAALLAGGALRFWRLGEAPAGLYCDEAFQGYEAYSLLRTGADSRGRTLPLFFNIFDVGLEEPLYPYLTMLPVALAGTTAAAARMVAAGAGTLAIAATAILASTIGGRAAAAGAAVLMALSPWAFHFSRVGFQASLLPLALAAGGALLVRSCAPGENAGDAPPRAALLAAGAAFLGLSLYTYVAARALVPLILAGFAAAFLPALRRAGAARLLAAAAVLALLAAPVLVVAASPSGRERLQDVGLASRAGGVEAIGRFTGNYLSYLSTSFLLSRGDPNARHGVAGFGALHAHDLLFLLVGVGGALARRRPADLLLLWWLAVAPIPAALAADPAHAVRAIGVLPALYALAGSGAAALLHGAARQAPGRARRRLALAAVLAAAALSSGAYLRAYFGRFTVEAAPAFQYGLREAFLEAERLAPGHDSIYVTRATDFPFVVRLYALAFPPEEYQAHRFGRTKYLFDEPVFYRGGLVPGRRSPLFLLRPNEVPEGLEAVSTIANPDGSPAWILAR